MNQLKKADSYIEKNKVPKEQRPAFHVTAPVGWINDPNGFSEYRNKYHLFYQHHPYSDAWGPMHWGHCTSCDFIKWEDLPEALAPDESFDKNGCFSGSALETDEGHALVYTGVIEKDENGKKSVFQNQCLAFGNGENYIKYDGNPVIDGNQLPDSFSREDFRDPKIWFDDGSYYLVAGNRKGDGLGQVVLFRSPDLKSWQYVTVLAENDGTYGKMWECPDFFELGDQHVLIVSPQDMRAVGNKYYNGNHVLYFLGQYNKTNCQFDYSEGVMLDFGADFYAAQTLLTNDGRRIMIAWMQSWDINIKPAEQRWNGMMTVPRELSLINGHLYQRPVRELENYLVNPIHYQNMEISGEVSLPGIKGRVLDLSAEVLSGDFKKLSIHIAHNDEYTTCFTYNPEEQSIEFDRTYSGMRRDVVSQRKMKIDNPQSTLKLRLILDKYSAELFVNDGYQTFSATFYTPLEADEIVFKCDGKAILNIEKSDIRI